MIRQADREAGVTIVIVALLMVTMLVTTALVVGHGNTRQTRREAQNIVDAAALAAAAELDGDFGDASGAPLFTGGNGNADHADAEARALQYVEANGLAGRGDVSITFVQQGTSECIEVAVENIDARVWFGEVVGQESLAIGAQSLGCRGTFSEGASGPGSVANGPNVPASHSGGVCGDKPGFDSSGANNLFIGDIYANDNPKNGNSSNAIQNGTARYRGNVEQDNGNVLWLGPNGEQVGSANPTSGQEVWPPGFHPVTELPISAFAPGGARALAYGGGITGVGPDPFYKVITASDLGANMAPGVYYISGSGTSKLEIPGNFSVGPPRQGRLRIDPATGLPSSTGEVRTVDANGITIVTTRYVESGGDHVDMPAFNWELNRLALYTSSSNGESGINRCDKPVVQIGDSCVHFDGVVFAPNGAVNFGSGEGNGNDHNGSSCGHSHPGYSGGFIGYGIKINGNKGLYRSGPGSLVSDPGDPGSGQAGRIYLGG